MTFHDYLGEASVWLWSQIISHLWQSTLFLFLIMMSVALLRESAARVRYAVWLMASAKFVLPLSAFAAFGQWLEAGKFFPLSPTVESNASDGIGFAAIVSLDIINGAASVALEPAASHNETYCILTIVWGFGCLFLFALWRKRSREFKGLLSQNIITPLPDSREMKLLKNAQRRTGSAADVNLSISDGVREPTLRGIRKPTIVIPRGLSQNLADDEFELILMHELAHVARRDNLTGVLQMALCCLFWFHPLVWFINRKLLEERERACDEEVIRHEGEPGNYISGLLKVVRFGLYSGQSAGLANTTGANLKKRMELIMKNKIKNTNSAWQQWVIGSTAASLILVCVVAVFALAQTNSAASDQKSAATQINEVGKEGDQDKSELIRQIQASPNVPYNIVGNEDSPLKITEASGKEISNAQYTKLTGSATVTTDAGGKTIFPNVYSAPEVTMTNSSGKTITGYSLAVRDSQSEKVRFKITRRISIIAGQSYVTNTATAGNNRPMTSEKYWLEFPNKEKFYVMIARVSFDDNTTWTAKE